MTPPESAVPAQDTVIAVAYDSDCAQLLARLTSEAKVYSEVQPYTRGAETILAEQPAALVIAARSSGQEDLPPIDLRLLTAGIPVLAVGGGFLAVAKTLGGTITPSADLGEQEIQVDNIDRKSALFSGQETVQDVAVNVDAAVKIGRASCRERGW